MIASNVTIIAPVDGVVTGVGEHVNPYAGNVLFEIGIAVNWAWTVKLVLEPGFLDSVNNSLQSDLIDVSYGQQVHAGDELATLLHSENYPHLHYMLLSYGQDVCAYNYSSSSAQTIFEEIATDSNSTILYPYPESNPVLSPMILIPAVALTGYWVLALAIFTLRKE